jgi:hypothetical protein
LGKEREQCWAKKRKEKNGKPLDTALLHRITLFFTFAFLLFSLCSLWLKMKYIYSVAKLLFVRGIKGHFLYATIKTVRVATPKPTRTNISRIARLVSCAAILTVARCQSREIILFKIL